MAVPCSAWHCECPGAQLPSAKLANISQGLDSRNRQNSQNTVLILGGPYCAKPFTHERSRPPKRLCAISSPNSNTEVGRAVLPKPSTNEGSRPP